MTLSAPKGTHDLLPETLATWQYIENLARQAFTCAGFSEIRTPIFETTELFERGVGESTDIVNKEMYTFEKGERSLTLRPENTAGVVRAYIQHGMDRWPKPVKLFYMGPMFRYERPQAGRQRQFHQLGAELFGVDTPQADAEVIILAYDFFSQLGLKDLKLDINNVGCFICRDDFRNKLRDLVRPYFDQLCSDCQRRFETNPLRMLDCKNPTCQAVFAKPEIQAFLSEDPSCESCQIAFNQLLELLETAKIPYNRNRMLVRGLDYYTRTVFEMTSNHLGAQNAVCGGGRYNGLVQQLGGPDTPGVGWALGMERLVSLVQTQSASKVQFYIVSDDSAAATALARQLRQAGHTTELDLSGKAFGKQLAHAAKLNAQYAILLGESERAQNQVTVKNLATSEQTVMNEQTFLKQSFGQF